MSLLTPAQHSVKYYSSADAGAPQISNADFAIKNIIKACLVTGYGTKAGAGWTALFENTNKIVLRRPLGAGSPVDVKIINGFGLHQIVGQDNPTSIDDNSALSSVYFIAKDSLYGAEWHMIVSDFGFIFCYQMGSGSSAYPRNNILYIGSMMPLKDTPAPMLMLKSAAAKQDGNATSPAHSLLDSGVSFVDMRSGVNISSKGYLSTTLDSLSDFVQKPLIGTFFTPFYISLGAGSGDRIPEIVTIKGRSMLKWPNVMEAISAARLLFIPLDYWEL